MNAHCRRLCRFEAVQLAVYYLETNSRNCNSYFHLNEIYDVMDKNWRSICNGRKSCCLYMLLLPPSRNDHLAQYCFKYAIRQAKLFSIVTARGRSSRFVLRCLFLLKCTLLQRIRLQFVTAFRLLAACKSNDPSPAIHSRGYASFQGNANIP